MNGCRSGLRNAPEDQTLHALSVGCSTGEEAYSARDGAGCRVDDPECCRNVVSASPPPM
jgi:hypothetical protein